MHGRQVCSRACISREDEQHRHAGLPLPPGPLPVPVLPPPSPRHFRRRLLAAGSPGMAGGGAKVSKRFQRKRGRCLQCRCRECQRSCAPKRTPHCHVAAERREACALDWMGEGEKAKAGVVCGENNTMQAVVFRDGHTGGSVQVKCQVSLPGHGHKAKSLSRTTQNGNKERGDREKSVCSMRHAMQHALSLSLLEKRGKVKSERGGVPQMHGDDTATHCPTTHAQHASTVCSCPLPTAPCPNR